MEKLKLEHVAPYLAYGVKFISELDKPYEDYGKQPIWTLNGVHELFGEYSLLTKENKDSYDINKCKPILRPMSDLFKLIDWDNNNDPYMIGYKYGIEKVFEDGEEFYANEYYAEQCESPKCYIDIKSFDWWLFVYHFDIFGLIDKGLAIDINTL